MDISSFRLLLTPTGQKALLDAEALQPRENDFLSHYQSLSRRYPADMARAALETAILRLEAKKKFLFAERMYFTREALEQASPWEVSTYRAQRYRSFVRMIDLGCSIGSDTLALANVAPTTGVDLDPLRLAMAQTNAIALKPAHEATFLRADISVNISLSLKPLSSAFFFDPSRRANYKRVYSVRDYTPPLSIIESWLRQYPALGVKISPGVNLEEIEHYDAEVEFISLRGELKEAVLWFGPLKVNNRRATLLPGPHSLASDMFAEELITRKLPLSEPLRYIYEPDPAVLRAGLVYNLGEQLGACQLDPDIAYLTSSEHERTPFARAWEIVDWFPFGLKRLRAYLREQTVGRVTVKKRGSPIQPDALIHDLRLEGDEERVVFLTHLRGRPIVVICYPNTIEDVERNK